LFVSPPSSTDDRSGFWKVVGGARRQKANIKHPQVSVQLLRPEELRLMLAGLSASDQQTLYSAQAFKALQEHARYVEFDSDDVVVRWFWDVVLQEFNDDERRKLLWFVTASDRVPLGGLREIEFVLQKNGSDETRIPTSYTCFGRLLLPAYKSKAALKKNLELAIEESKGFGLI
jgi:hypothetical protein